MLTGLLGFHHAGIVCIYIYFVKDFFLSLRSAAVPQVSGAAAWCWADYRDRHGFTNDFPTYFGPFGIVTFDRHPKKAHALLRALWSQSVSGEQQ